MHTSQLSATPQLNALLSLAFAALVALRAGAATEVCGLIENQTWTAAGSPYLVTCDAQVDSLHIEPGVVVQFQSNYVFQVTGSLLATGTETEPITFTTTAPAVGWQGIFFNEVAPLSVLDRCVVEGSTNSGVRIKNSIVEIKNCVFRDNSAFQGGGINVDNTLSGFGELTLTGCTFSNNVSISHGGAVRANVAANSIRFDCCIILANRAGVHNSSSYHGGGVDIIGNSSFSNCTIADNMVTACTSSGMKQSSGGGVFLDGNGGAVFKNCVISNNAAEIVSCPGSGREPRAYGGGIRLYTGTLTLINCIVAYNRLFGSGAYGGGVFVDSGARGMIQNCTIAYNTINNANASSAGAVYGRDTSMIRNSIIYFNEAGGPQIEGTTNIFYSDVQNGTTDNGNITANPSFNPACLRITFNSPCKDAGDPDPLCNDVCIDDVNSCAPFSRGTSRNDMGAHGGPGACLWEACSAPGEPPIVSGPASASTCFGRDVTFCATAASNEAVSYRWLFEGVPIDGATDSCLTVTNVQAVNGGTYSVEVCNAFGCATNSASLAVYPACVDIQMYAGLTIAGQIGETYVLKFTTDLSDTNFANWTALATNTLGNSNWFYLDLESPFSPKRFYGVDLQP